MNLSSKKVIGILGLIGFLILLYYISGIVTYVLISVVIALVLEPVVTLLDKVEIKQRQLPAALKAVIALGGFYTLIYGIMSLFIPLLAEEVNLLREIDFDKVYESLKGPISLVEKEAKHFNLQPIEGDSHVDLVRDKLLGFLDISQIPDLFGSLVSGLGNVFFAFFSISFITFFLLKDRWILDNFINVVVPDKYLEKVKTVASNSQKTLSRYFIGLLAQISLITTLISLSLYLLGVDNALVIGFFAGLINVIPYIGPLIGAVFGIIIASTTNLDMQLTTELLPLVLKVATVFLVVQLSDNIIFQPIIFSNSINAHPLEIFLVIMVAGQVAGIAGMVLAVPAYSFLRILGKEFFSEFKIVRSMTENV